MKADKNTIIGFVLLGVLFFLFFWNNNRMQQTMQAEQKKQTDSLQRIKDANRPPLDTVAAKADSARRAAEEITQKNGVFGIDSINKEELVTVENELIKVNFTNKGGRVKSVQLKNYKSFDSTLVTLGADDQIGYGINTGSKATMSNELFFQPQAVVKNADGSQTISFIKASANGEKIENKYTIKPNEYAVDWDININGADKVLTAGALNFQFHAQPQQHEKSVTYERQQSNICFSEDNEFDYISSKTEHKFEKPAQWVSAVQQFFNTTLIAKSQNSFATGDIKWTRTPEADSTKELSKVDAALQMKLPSASSATAAMQLYYGPNNYNILKKQAPEMDRIINLGRDMYSFVRPINKYIITPVFNFFASFVKNYGWVILLLTLFIRLVTAPLTYTSYLSGAKMKVLRPELDELKKKFGTDQQGFAMEQMKLFREAGVNPLGGCIPALLQIPIFFALYSFFNSNIALRGQEFLWSNDLSSFDAIISWKTTIWGLGNHLSLFTITAVLTSFLISIYNMSMTPTQDNPALKYMPYIFPFILFFVFNRLPSALTWYYTVSNIITLGLQFVIQNYIIDHKKILVKIEEKRKNPKVKAKSKWQERYEQMMESQKKVQDLKNKNKK